MSWRLANSLDVLRDQVNALAPHRKKTDDGTIGNEAHQQTSSDHNPNSAGVVCAIDFTHDPSGGFDSYEFAETLRRNRDPRIHYVISNGRIWNTQVSPYVWRDYNGANKHDQHVHISVNQSQALYDNETPWNISRSESADASAKGSWYSQHRGKYNWIDLGDAPNSSALGVPDDDQGIAFYDRATLGKWFDVTAPNGVTLRLQQTDIGPHPRTGRGIDIAAVAAERFGYSPDNFPTDEIFHWRPAAESTPVPNQPPVIMPPTPRVDANIWADMFAQIGPIIAKQIKEELQKPETQQAVKGIVATALPKLLAGLGVSVPGVGIVMMVAGYVLPLLMPHLMGADAGTATLVSGLGLTGIPVVSKILGVLDRFKARDDAP